MCQQAAENAGEKNREKSIGAQNGECLLQRTSE